MGLEKEKMTMLNRFNLMAVRNKKPIMPWAHLVDKEQSLAERNGILAANDKNTIGVICGPVSKVFVLDDDGSQKLKSYHLPRTATVNTPRGGRHYYFRWVPELDGKITTRTDILGEISETVRKGVDARGHGGYVVWYGWQNPPNVVPFARPPQWLIDVLPDKTRTREIGKPTTAQVAANIKEGNRNASFASLAGGLRARGYSVEAIFELLKPKAKEVGLAETELYAVCKSIGRYEPVKVDSQGESVDDFLSDNQVVEWICSPIIAKKSVGFVAGLPEAKKTWVLMDLAVECARGGGLWLKKFTTGSAKVLFIDQERAKNETQRRFKAILSAKSISTSSLKGKLFIRCGSSTKLDLQHSYDAFRKELADIKPDLIIVDSFATFHTKNESNRMEIQQVLERVKRLRDEFNCTFLFVHHETKASYQNRKDGGVPSYLDMSGNVAIPAAAETTLSVVQHDDEKSMVHHTKSTMGIKIPPFIVKVIDLLPDRSKISVEAY